MREWSKEIKCPMLVRYTWSFPNQSKSFSLNASTIHIWCANTWPQKKSMLLVGAGRGRSGFCIVAYPAVKLYLLQYPANCMNPKRNQHSKSGLARDGYQHNWYLVYAAFQLMYWMIEYWGCGEWEATCLSTFFSSGLTFSTTGRSCNLAGNNRAFRLP